MTIDAANASTYMGALKTLGQIKRLRELSLPVEAWM